MSLVNSSLAINDLIAKYVGRIIFHISASNWKIVFDRLSDKINTIASHPEPNPDSIDLQLMSHAVLDRVRLVMLLNRVFNRCFFLVSLLNKMNRMFFVTGQHEDGVPTCNCRASQIRYLELD
jgi:hypothetical protein